MAEDGGENAGVDVEYLDLAEGMPRHFEMPQEFLELAGRSSRQGFVRDGYGYLADPDKGAHCLVRLGEQSDLPDWSGYLRDPRRLWHVVSTGGEGSSVCLWLDDAGNQHVVHHGSGSGSILFAVLPSALSVLRLFAVGCEEPCWNYDWADPPEGTRPHSTRSGNGLRNVGESNRRGPESTRWGLGVMHRSG
jgi:hypothetical protein